MMTCRVLQLYILQTWCTMCFKAPQATFLTTIICDRKTGTICHALHMCQTIQTCARTLATAMSGTVTPSRDGDLPTIRSNSVWLSTGRPGPPCCALHCTSLPTTAYCLDASSGREHVNAICPTGPSKTPV